MKASVGLHEGPGLFPLFSSFLAFLAFSFVIDTHALGIEVFLKLSPAGNRLVHDGSKLRAVIVRAHVRNFVKGDKREVDGFVRRKVGRD